MRSYLTEMFGISLTLTIGVELAVAALLEEKWINRRGKTERPEKGESRRNGRGVIFSLFGQQYGKGILLVVLVNVLTNPPAVWLCWLGGLYMPQIPKMAVQLVTELAVVLVEACIYRSFAQSSRWNIHRPVRLAVTANACSWLLGAILTP